MIILLTTNGWKLSKECTNEQGTYEAIPNKNEADMDNSRRLVVNESKKLIKLNRIFQPVCRNL